MRGWQEFWPLARRDLLGQLVKRQVLARYRGARLGVLWSLLTPLLMLVVYSLVFRHVFKVRWEGGADTGLDFSLHLFAGLWVFSFVSEVLSRSPHLILEQPNLVKKVVFPLELLAWTNLLAALIFALPTGVLLLLACMLNGVAPTLLWLLLPLVWLPLLPWALGLGWMLSAVGVYLRDIAQILGLVITLLQFLSPVFFPLSAVPERLQVLMQCNPLTGVIEATRGVLFLGQVPHWPTLWPQAVAGIVVALAGAWVFRLLRPGFADVL